MDLIHVNAALQTNRAGWLEMLLVRLFGTSRTEASEVDPSGHVVLRKWRGRTYMWN